jgi:hypothetical protein
LREQASSNLRPREALKAASKRRALRTSSAGMHDEACEAVRRTNQTPGRVCGRLRLCRCPKGAAASRERSGINASGEAEAKQACTKPSWLTTTESFPGGRQGLPVGKWRQS